MERLIGCPCESRHAFHMQLIWGSPAGVSAAAGPHASWCAPAASAWHEVGPLCLFDRHRVHRAAAPVPAGGDARPALPALPIRVPFWNPACHGSWASLHHPWRHPETPGYSCPVHLEPRRDVFPGTERRVAGVEQSSGAWARREWESAGSGLCRRHHRGPGFVSVPL